MRKARPAAPTGMCHIRISKRQNVEYLWKIETMGAPVTVEQRVVAQFPQRR